MERNLSFYKIFEVLIAYFEKGIMYKTYIHIGLHDQSNKTIFKNIIEVVWLDGRGDKTDKLVAMNTY